MSDPGDSVLGYELEPTPEAPRLPGDVVFRRDADDAVGALAADLLIHAQNCVRSFGDFHMALSGGSTPQPLYMRLMTDPLYRSFPWTWTHLWQVDERCVPIDDPRSNYRMITDYLGSEHSDIPRANLHPMPVLEREGDAAYERELRHALAWRERGHDRLDFVLLGMGADAHTASLFPGSPAQEDREKLVRFNDGPSVTPPPRMTLTYPAINGARLVSVLVTGQGKGQTLRRVAERAESIDAPAVRELPILGVSPVGGRLRWYLDHASCA